MQHTYIDTALYTQILSFFVTTYLMLHVEVLFSHVEIKAEIDK